MAVDEDFTISHIANKNIKTAIEDIFYSVITHKIVSKESFFICNKNCFV